MKYLLFIFAKHETDQDKFVKIMAEDISCVSNEGDVTYYFGPESAIFHFESSENFSDLSEFFRMLLGSLKIVYFLSPYEPDKMSFHMNTEIEKQLFKTDKSSQTTRFTDEQIEIVQKLLFDIEEGEETPFIKNKRLSLDDLLDKISELGFSSLTEEEKKLLNEYSK